MKHDFCSDNSRVQGFVSVECASEGAAFLTSSLRINNLNSSTLIMAWIFPHQSTQLPLDGNHPFPWVSVCNDFSPLVPSDLPRTTSVAVCSLARCIMASEAFSGASGRQKRVMLSPLMASSERVLTSLRCRLSVLPENFTLIHRLVTQPA